LDRIDRITGLTGFGGGCSLKKMKLAAIISLILTSSLIAEEWAVVDGLSPSKKQELVTIPIFDTDPPNGTPFRVALRDASSKEILDSFLWEGDMGDPQAHKQNKAFWSPDGQYVAVYMRAGRLSATTAYFVVERGKLIRVTPPDAWQNVLGRFNTTKAGPNGGISPVEWTDKNHLKMAIIGSADTKTGRIPFHFHAVYRFVSGEPWVFLESVEPATDDSEQDGGGQPATRPELK